MLKYTIIIHKVNMCETHHEKAGPISPTSSVLARHEAMCLFYALFTHFEFKGRLYFQPEIHRGVKKMHLNLSFFRSLLQFVFVVQGSSIGCWLWIWKAFFRDDIYLSLTWQQDIHPYSTNYVQVQTSSSQTLTTLSILKQLKTNRPHPKNYIDMTTVC